MNYHAHLIKSLTKKVEDVKTKAYQPPLISYFDELPRKTFVIHDENRAQLYKESITYLYQENQILTDRITKLE